MFELTFLGTSASVPSAARNHPGLLVEAGGRRIMMDCGEGTQRQLLRSGIQSRSRDIELCRVWDRWGALLRGQWPQRRPACAKHVLRRCREV